MKEIILYAPILQNMGKMHKEIKHFGHEHMMNKWIRRVQTQAVMDQRSHS